MSDDHTVNMLALLRGKTTVKRAEVLHDRFHHVVYRDNQKYDQAVRLLVSRSHTWRQYGNKRGQF